MKRKFTKEKLLISSIFATLIASTVFLIMAVILAPTVADTHNPLLRIKSDYALMLLQCVLGIFAMLLPGMLKKRLNLEIPSNMLILYAIFLYCAIYLGEVRSFYYIVPHWDTILHTFSGAMLGALGFSFVTFLNKTDNVPLNLSPLFVAAFALCFAVTLGVVWEIYEFTIDLIFKTNMQKFATENGEPLLGAAALLDTMKDLIVDIIGAFFMSCTGYISLKHEKGWLEKLQLKIR